MNFLDRMIQSKIVILLIIGVMLLVISRVIKRGRPADEYPGAVERLIWAGGILITVASLIYAGSRGCMVDVPEKDKKHIPEYSKETPGCSKPEEGMKDYKK